MLPPDTVKAALSVPPLYLVAENAHFPKIVVHQERVFRSGKGSGGLLYGRKAIAHRVKRAAPTLGLRSGQARSRISSPCYPVERMSCLSCAIPRNISRRAGAFLESTSSCWIRVLSAHACLLS